MNSCYVLDKKIKQICYSNYNLFLSKKNVLGVGLGYKTIRTFTTNQRCIVVFVNTKLPQNKILYKDFIPPCFCGIITDVIEIGNVSIPSRSYNCSCFNTPLHNRTRPFNGGFSVGAPNQEDCSVGCLVRDSNDVNYILTSNSGVAKNNEASKSITPILQPSSMYGGGFPRVATVTNFTKVNQLDANLADAALCRVEPESVLSGIYGVGNLTGVEEPFIGMKVMKVGSGSYKTTGKMVSLGLIMKLQYMGQEVLFKDQIITKYKSKCMSAPGDEGAILINQETMAGVGILMTQTNEVSIFSLLSNVLNLFNVNIV